MQEAVQQCGSRKRGRTRKGSSLDGRPDSRKRRQKRCPWNPAQDTIRRRGGGERNSAPPSTSSGCSSRLPTSNPPLSSHPIRNCTKRTPHRDGAFETSATGSACCWKTPTKRARNGRPGNET